MNTITKRYPVFKSNDVEDAANHVHKLWWANIEQIPTGQYQVVTYAQIWSIDSNGVATGEEIRKYETKDITSTQEHAERCYNDRVRKKVAAKGYSKFQDRDEAEITTDQAIINKFLQDYGQVGA